MVADRDNTYRIELYWQHFKTKKHQKFLGQYENDLWLSFDLRTKNLLAVCWVKFMTQNNVGFTAFTPESELKTALTIFGNAVLKFNGSKQKLNPQSLDMLFQSPRTLAKVLPTIGKRLMDHLQNYLPVVAEKGDIVLLIDHRVS